MHIKQPGLLDKSGFTYSTWGPFTKNKERIQKLKKKHEIQDMFTEMNQMKIVFNIKYLMDILKIYQEEQFQIKL